MRATYMNPASLLGLLGKKGGTRSAAANMSVGVASAGLMFAVEVLFARMMNPAEFGRYAFALVLVNMLCVPFLRGTPLLITRNVAGHLALQNYGNMRSFAKMALKWVSLGTLFVALCTTTALLVFPGAVSKTLRGAILAAVPLIFLLPLAALHVAILVGLGIIARARALLLIGRPLGAVLMALILFYMWRNSLSSVEAMLCQDLAVVIIIFVLLFLVRRQLDQYPLHGQYRYDTQRWIRMALPFIGIGALEFINIRSGVLLLQLFASSSSVGMYKGCLSIAELILFSFSTLSQVASTYIAKHNATGNHSAAQSVISRISLFNALFGGLMWLIIVVFTDRLLAIYGTEFVAAKTALRILATGVFIRVAIGPAELAMKMLGGEKVILLYLCSAGLVNIILSSLFIPLWDMAGAAIAHGISWAGLNAALSIAVIRRYGIATCVLYRNKPETAGD
jgi:O-antigen/teichoic acid export membrane protein